MVGVFDEGVGFFDVVGVEVYCFYYFDVCFFCLGYEFV